MKVILMHDVLNLGEEGDVCTVKNGYGRNYLLPQKMAIPFNKSNLLILEQKKDIITKRKEEKLKQAMGLKERLENEPLEISMPAGDTGKLFGGVTNATIAEELNKHGIQIERKRIELPEHTLKMVGDYNIKIRLYDKESAQVKLTIVKIAE
ncbi:MAG: 50S ribosomal protein L9 [Spirochaetales bacterium]|nr:MAG: 50S ribosomal protein L9 [Spirochaetales bacterium]